MKETELVGTKPIQDLIELALYTLYIVKERIVSVMIVAFPESGKTELVKKYRSNNGVYPMRRSSAYGIIEAIRTGKLSPRFKKRLGHLLIYDFSHLFSLRQRR